MFAAETDLDRKINPHAADRRHGVSGVADAQKPGPAPLFQTIDADGEEFDTSKLFIPRCGPWRKAPGFQVPAGRPEAPCANGSREPFGINMAALPIVAAIDHDDDVTASETGGRLFGVGFAARETEPQHVHWSADVFHGEPALLSRHRVPPVASDHKLRIKPQRAIGRLGDDTRDFVAIPDEIRRFRLHEKFEGGIRLSLHPQGNPENPTAA